jgi:hypothetical protein
MAVNVVKIGEYKHTQHSEAAKLRAQVAKLKSQKRGISLRYTNLYNRTDALIEYLDDYIVPMLKTSRKKQCEEHIEQVRRLL